MTFRGVAIVWLAAWPLAVPVATAETSPSPETAAAARALIQRVLPAQAGRFIVETIPADNGHDVFEVAGRDGQIVLRGNSGVSIASGLNWYLANVCHCDVSWNCGNQLDLPNPLPPVRKPIRVVSPWRFRYAYNFCTHGYTMAWWGWPQWRREIDFLALSGVNLALVIEGQESVWLSAFAGFGYSPAELRRWVADPAHLPWMEMGNLESCGGPLPLELIQRRLKLGQRILARMRELGIEPVLPGYYGIVPPEFKKRFPAAKVLAQGDWSVLRRPDILDPTDPLFAKVAGAFYSAQDRLLGGARFYAADPFHEGGSTSGIDLPAAGRAIFKAMNVAAPPRSPNSSSPAAAGRRGRGPTWVLQSWQSNPRPELIDGLDKNRLLVLDLWCEARENWRLRHSFNGVPWLWCTIENFGGNTGLGGRLGWMADGPARAFADPAKARLSGIGALMEGGGTIPALWELFLQNAWRTNAPELGDWLDDYCRRRYGAKIPAAERAWRILAATVYDAPKSDLELPVNSAVCARPSLDPNQNARQWSSTRPYYDPARLVRAWELLLAAAPQAHASDGYRFDLCDVGRQALADLGTRYDHWIIAAYRAKDTNRLRVLSAKMLGLIRDMDRLAGTRKELLLGTWLAEARSWGATPAEKNLCERDARELLTVWTGRDNLTDYANRQWNGLLGQFYYHRWATWLKALNESLAHGRPLDVAAERATIRDWELWWTRQTNGHFATQPRGDVVAVSRELFAKYSSDASRPERDEPPILRHAPSRNDAVQNGERGRPGCTGRRRADRIAHAKDAPNSMDSARAIVRRDAEHTTRAACAPLTRRFHTRTGTARGPRAESGLPAQAGGPPDSWPAHTPGQSAVAGGQAAGKDASDQCEEDFSGPPKSARRRRALPNRYGIFGLNQPPYSG